MRFIPILLPISKVLSIYLALSILAMNDEVFRAVLIKNIAQILDAYILAPEARKAGLLQFFQTTVMNTALRNGDAHLKNFGLLYEDPTQEPILAPAYDIVCTTAWIPHDQPALPMNGLREWPDADALRDFGKTFCHLDDEAVTRVFTDTLDALRNSNGLLEDLQAKYPDVTELQHLREVMNYHPQA